MNRNKLQYLILIISYLLNVLFIVLIYSNNYNSCYNSDHLFAPSFFNDILNEGNSIKGWNLPGAPGFFPDMIIYFFLFLLFKNIGMTFLIFSIIQVILILLFFNILIRQIMPEIKLSVLAVSNTLLCLVYLVTLLPGHIDSMSFHLLAINYHTGTLISTLLCLYLSVKFIKKRSWITLTILFAVCTLCVLSDKLIIIYFILPFTVSLVIHALKKEHVKKNIVIAGVLLLSVIFGILIYNWFRISIFSFGHVDFKLHHENSIKSFRYIGDLYSVIIKEGTIRTAVLILSTLSFLACCCLVLCKLTGETLKKGNYTGSFPLMSLYCLYIAISFLITILTPALLGKINTYNDIRYIEVVFYLGLLNVVILVYYIFKYGKTIVFMQVIIPFLIISLLIFALINNRPSGITKGLQAYFNYYPSYIKFLDDASDKYDLKNGCSYHWYSKVINMFSKNNVRVYTVYNSLYPYPVLSNGNWYYKDINNNSEQTVFNFYYVNNKFGKDNIYKQFGDSITEVKYNDINLIIVPDFTFNKKNGKIQLK